MNNEKEREDFESIPENIGLLRGAKFSDCKYVAISLFDDSSKECATQLNYGWSTWQAAKADEAKKLEGCLVVPEAEFSLLPKTITPEIEEILGMPCFKFIKAAQIYRQLGFDIPPKAEKEQSFFMFKFLHLALVHGDKCFDVFESETKAMVEAARGGNE